MKIAKVVMDKMFGDYRIIIRHIKDTDYDEFKRYDNWYCGYVAIPEDDRFYEIDENSELLEQFTVHGGISFVGRLNDIDGFLIGFDCNHAHDNPQEQDELYVFNECKSLLRQIKEANEDYNISFKIYSPYPKKKDEILQYMNRNIINFIDRKSDMVAYDLEIE